MVTPLRIDTLCLESPFLALKARFVPRHRPTAAPALASAPEPPVTTNPVSA